MDSRMRLVGLVVAAFGCSIALSFPARSQQAMGDLAPPPPPPSDDEDDFAPAGPAQPVPAPAAGPPARAPTVDTFVHELAPYGRWVDTPEYGRVWIPSNVDPDWRPYTDGQWMETSWGWSFVSVAPWGWATFHYGRWGYTAGFGWFWVPGYVWAPAWVSWRYYQGYVCWAPYGPAHYAYPRVWPGWVVVPSRAFLRPIRHHVVPHSTAAPIVRVARPAPSIGRVPVRGSFYGPPRATVHPRSGPARAGPPPRAARRTR
ncbi:MAG: DUF6600 domain-containing protein [Myxococcales bacterium]